MNCRRCGHPVALTIEQTALSADDVEEHVYCLECWSQYREAILGSPPWSERRPVMLLQHGPKA